MIYAIAHGIVGAGLLLTAAMAIGMIGTILVFVVCTILLRDRALLFLVRTAEWRDRLGRALESASAVAVIAFGLWLFVTRAT
jgi:ABC-type nickel/cobalt efflux system permease component RcnA